MDKRHILQSIIDNDGMCKFMYADGKYIAGFTHACRICPMSKLSTRTDGTYLSCHDALITDPRVDPNPVYKEKAIEILGDILMDDILRGTPIAEDS